MASSLKSLSGFFSVNREILFQTTAFILFAICLNVGIFFIIQLMVTGDPGKTSAGYLESIDNFIRVERVTSEPEPQIQEEELEETLPEEELPKPDMPKPDVAPPAPTSTLSSPVPAPDLSLTNTGIDSLSKILNASRGRLKPPAIATNLVPTLKIPPIYPQQALRMGIEGIVTVEFTIAIDGSVKNPKIVKARPKTIFDKAVLQAITKWKYQPKIINGRPQEIRARQDINFTLQ